MKRAACISGIVLMFCGSSVAAVLEKSDVVFMYEADARTYSQYGATVVAWGGKPTARALEEAKGLKFFGSVGMVTEFGRYYERFPTNYTEGLCRDISGQPVKVPWLTDHQHRGIPYWWCCTRQPVFRQYLRERVEETVKAGAFGVHIDDHLGTAGGLWLGLCFCDRCVEGFKDHLKSLPAERLESLGVTDPQTFDYRKLVKEWLAADQTKQRKPTQHPLWRQWSIYQYRSAASFMAELHSLATQTAGRYIPMGANAGLLWPGHLADYKAIDFFSAETDHQAHRKRVPDAPLFAYRIAEAVERPYAATASGGDWAFIKENELHGLVRTWIALAYASGQLFMVPHRKWCYTPEKGTHWYDGPTEVFAPIYKFVRANADLFDGYETWSDLGVVVPHRTYMQNPARWVDICSKLSGANVSYRALLGGDEIVDHPLKAEHVHRESALLVLDHSELLASDRVTLDAYSKDKAVFHSVEEAVEQVRPVVRVEAQAPLRVLPRVRPGKTVIHVVNYDYDSTQDKVREIHDVKLTIDLGRLGLPSQSQALWVPFEGPKQPVKLDRGTVLLPSVRLWGLLVLE